MHTLRQALRIVTKTPWLSAVVIASLAIGISANTVIFSWLKAQVFEPLPRVSAPVWSLETTDDTGDYVSTSWLEYRDLRGTVSSFKAIAAQRPRSFSLGESENEARTFGGYVSENFFEVLDLRPAMGRFFRADEATRPGAEPVVVISYDLWQRQFHGAADAIGRSLQLNHQTLTVIGFTPELWSGCRSQSHWSCSCWRACS